MSNPISITPQSPLTDVIIKTLFEFQDIVLLSPTSEPREQPLFVLTLGQTPNGACFRRCLINWAERITGGPWPTPKVEFFARHVYQAQEKACIMDHIALAEARDDCRTVYTFPYFRLEVTAMAFVRGAISGAVEVARNHRVRLPWDPPAPPRGRTRFIILDEFDKFPDDKSHGDEIE